MSGVGGRSTNQNINRVKKNIKTRFVLGWELCYIHNSERN